VLDDQYCATYGNTALTPLFDTLLKHENLAIAVFGSMELAEEQRRCAKQYPDPAICEDCGCE